MKLKNKKTGEIGELQITEKHCAVAVGNGTASCGIEIYSSLAELNEEWCDYEEPKEYWYIDWNGEVCRSDIHDERTEQMKQIGNYFSSREEAELALRKLQAWKRLKDKGFRFDNWDLDADDEDVNVLLRSDKYKGNQVYVLEKDLDICFGGEE